MSENGGGAREGFFGKMIFLVKCVSKKTLERPF